MNNYINSNSAVRVYRALQDGSEYTLKELAEVSCVSLRSLDNMISIFFACGLAHISRWERRSEIKFQQAAIYKVGPGENAKREKRGIHEKYVWLETSLSTERIVENLTYPKTHQQCAEELGIALEYAGKLLRMLTQAKRTHVVKWIKNGHGQHKPVYAAGEGKSVPRPAAQHPSVITANRRRRLVEEHGVEIARRINQPRSKGGPDSIVIDGKTIYRRGEDRRKA